LAQVVICCCEGDALRADRLVRYLEGRGVEVFYYKRTPAGENWVDHIKGKIRQALAVVVLWSEQSISNVNVQSEALLAKSRGRYLPVYLDRLDPSDLNMGDLAIQGLFLSDPASQAEMNKFDEAIDRHILRHGPLFYQLLIEKWHRAAQHEKRGRVLAEARLADAQRGFHSDEETAAEIALLRERNRDLARVLELSLSKLRSMASLVEETARNRIGLDGDTIGRLENAVISLRSLDADSLRRTDMDEINTQARDALEINERVRKMLG
jgi:hypothetical protein